MNWFLVILCSVLYGHYIGVVSLETVSDERLLEILRSYKFVVVLFTKEKCDRCDKYEKALFEKEDAIQHLDPSSTAIVTVVSSPLVRLYNPAKEPSIVFFRHGVPLLFDGPPDGDNIYDSFVENKEPCVRELTDETFEHLTQASSGSTTGDWFIFFHSPECVDCQRMQARLETACSKLKMRLNVASLNIATTGRSTAERFGVTQLPTFIFIRYGKMYRYVVPQYDIESLTSFPVENFKNVKEEMVPPPKTYMDELSHRMFEYVASFTLFQLCFIFLSISVIFSIAYKLSERREEKDKPVEEKKKKST